MENLLFQINDICEGVITKRPSAHCKTPYVADVSLENSSSILGHSPSLGCCGLAEKDSTVVLSQLPAKKNQTCSHRVELAILQHNEIKMYIGINPKLAESIVEECLKKHFISNLEANKFQREVKFLNSRFDFAGTDKDGKPFILEVKNVPLADYVDVPKKEKKKYTDLIQSKKWNEKIAYFPDGYRKNSTAVVSPRALKHIQELEEIAKSHKVRAILCFVIQRTDVSHFQTSNIDLTYKEAVYKAWQNGVEIKTIQVSWRENGACYFVSNSLPISLKNGEFI
jgi:DNA-binding sugar fermentation-stimulating protein